MSEEGEKFCPLCAEEMDLTDQQLKPCKCGYEICVWCWHHLMDMAEKDDSEGRCPACRAPYDKEKIVGMAANCERLVVEINMERKKSQKSKTKPSEGRKQLSSVRVIQRNLVYIVGLPLNLADEDRLQHREYFGQYGKVLKVSMSRTASGVIQQFPNNTCSVYITYAKEEEAIRCIQTVHGFVLDGRSLKACFGTTKYCHAWLRNVPCTNPDCLYLHEIGSQEDSFTKDEIISAYTRSRVQQITSATNNMLRRSGSVLPPPVDDHCNNDSASVVKSIVKNASNQNATSTSKGSPPNGSCGRSGALPAAASWGMRASNHVQVTSSTCSNGPTKPKPDTVSNASAFASAVASTTHISTLISDVGSKASWDEESRDSNGGSASDSMKLVKQNVGVEHRPTIPEKPGTSDATTTVTLSKQTSCTSASSDNDWSSSVRPNAANSIVHSGLSCGPENVAVSTNDGIIENLCSDKSSLRVHNNVKSEIFRTTDSLSPRNSIKLPVSEELQKTYAEPCREPLTSPEKRTALVNGVCALQDQCDWRADSETETAGHTVSELEDIISFDNQRLKDPEVVTRTSSYLPKLANSLRITNDSRSHSQQNESFGSISSNGDPLFIDDRVVDHPFLHESSNSLMSNGYTEKSISSSGSERNIEHSFLLSNEAERKRNGRLWIDADSSASLDGGESSIISNILDLDSWDESLTSQNLAKLWGETDQQPNSLKMSGSFKAQNNNQSRFSFARQEELINRAFEVDATFSANGQVQNHPSFGTGFAENRNSFLDKLGVDKGFSSSNFEELVGSSHLFSSVKPSVSRAQISAPPGFSLPNRTPPPGFSSHERMDQTFDTTPGNQFLDSSLLRNSYQTLQTGNIASTGDIEFVDPAILAVGKGMLQGSFNNPGLDMRSSFQDQLSAFDNEARLQQLMQRSLSSHQNLRYSGIGDSLSLGDSYGISSRIVDQSQASNLSPFAQLSHQQSRNGHMSNGHWNGWNEVQGGNNLAMAELLRNERLGFNKFYAAGYEDSKFRMPSSGNLYNRTFGM